MSDFRFFYQRVATEGLRHCNHDDVKTKLLPVVEKAMLRNPEVALYGECNKIDIAAEPGNGTAW